MKHNFYILRQVIPLLSFILFLSGCLSIPRSPVPRFYVLESVKDRGSVALADAGGLDGLIVGIGPVTLPGYFNRPQIATKSSKDTIEFAQFDRWAEPLSESMERLIARNLSVLLPEVNVEIFPWNSAMPIRYQVIMEVIQLSSRLQGETELILQWSVLDAQSKNMLFTRRSEYRRDAALPDYSGVVQAFSLIMESVSREVAQTLIDLAKGADAGKS